MARTVQTIKNDIKTKVRTYPSLDKFLFPEDTPVAGSAVSVFNLVIDIVSMCIYTFEVILDQLKADIQKIADTTAAGNNKWVQTQMFKFQYGDVITLINSVPAYAVIDPTKRIITQCAVRDLGSGVVAIKLAKGTAAPYLPLDSTELQAVQDYYYGTPTTEGIGFAGVRAQFITLDPDRLYVAADVYFFGQYIEATVKTNVIAAINAFLQSFTGDSFGGRIYMTRLEDAIQAVEGVSRVVFTLIKGRPEATPFGSALTITDHGFYDAVAGHVISEDDTGNTLDDSINMIEEPV